MEDHKQVYVPDSPEARQVALLGGYSADLIEAASALNIAATFTSEIGKPASDTYRFLIAHGVIAYARCFATSNVRAKLDTIVPMPSEHADIHKSMMDFRNRTVAHSERSLQVTYAVVDLHRVDEETTVERTLAVTLSSGIPRPVVEQVRQLITDL